MFGSTQNATLTIYSISCTSQILFENIPLQKHMPFLYRYNQFLPFKISDFEQAYYFHVIPIL